MKSVSAELPAVTRWSLYDAPRNLFGFRTPVPRREYAAFGVGLMLFKYAVEAAFIAVVAERIYTPLDFVNPLLVSRAKFTADAPAWLGMAWVMWTLPFLWIALSMSVRRARYLGWSPWWGLIVLAPAVNLAAMILFACVPDPKDAAEAEAERLAAEEVDRQIAAAYHAPETMTPPANIPRRGTSGVVAALTGMAGGGAFLVGMVWLSTFLFDSYGAVLFFGTPVLTGAIAAYTLNVPVRRSVGATLGHGLLTILVACFAFLMVGLEGAICIVMAVPIMAPLGLLGSLIGYTIAIGVRNPRRDDLGMWACIAVLPICGAVESYSLPTPTFEIMTPIEIAAPPAAVWREVVQFSDITEPPDWYFQLGIASPQRARIEGTGVGAVRYCEFTTGVFVEPITVWDPPRRLAFDVSEQPEPMFELTPYRHIHPPHLDGSFKSVRGEFLIVPLADGRTRLEGRTWYQLQIHPLSYWTIWSDALVHRIHGRVLRHIRTCAEKLESSDVAE